MTAASTVLRLGKLSALLFGAGAVLVSSAVGFLALVGASISDELPVKADTEAATVAATIATAVLLFYGVAVLEARRLLNLGVGVAAAYARYACIMFSVLNISEWVAAYLADVYLGVPGLAGPILLLAGCTVYGRDTVRRIAAAGLVAAGSLLLAASASSAALGVMYAASGLAAATYIVAEVAGLEIIGIVGVGLGVVVAAGAAAYYAYSTLSTISDLIPVTRVLDALLSSGSEIALIAFTILIVDVGLILSTIGAVLALVTAGIGVVVALTRLGGAISAEGVGITWRR